MSLTRLAAVDERWPADGDQWVSLTSDGDRFDIDCGRVRCRYSAPGYADVVRGDAVVVVPGACRTASRAIAHAVLPGDHGAGCVEIAVRRPSVRCRRPYRFAYVGARLGDVMAVSDRFAFVHRAGNPCDCDCYDGDGDDEEVSAVLLPPTADRPAAATAMTSFVSSLMDERSSAPQCPACAVPSNYRQVLGRLAENVERMSAADARLHELRNKYVVRGGGEPGAPHSVQSVALWKMHRLVEYKFNRNFFFLDRDIIYCVNCILILQRYYF